MKIEYSGAIAPGYVWESPEIKKNLLSPFFIVTQRLLGFLS